MRTDGSEVGFAKFGGAARLGLALLIGAVGATLTAKIDVSAPANVAAAERSLQSASRLRLPAAQQLVALAGADPRFDVGGIPPAAAAQDDRARRRAGEPRRQAAAGGDDGEADAAEPPARPVRTQPNVGALSALEAALP